MVAARHAGGARRGARLPVVAPVSPHAHPAARPRLPRGERATPVLAQPVSRDAGFRRPVRVFDLDPALLSELDAGTAQIVRARGVADSPVLRRGRWTPPAGAEPGPGAVGLLVLDGLLTRTIHFAGHESPELVGAGDLLRPWEEDDGIGSLAFDTEWRVLERTTVALLDARFAARICRAPGLVSALLGRTLERSRWLSFQLAIAHVRRAEPRVQMLLWHLADRWGRVTPSGTVVPLRLTHGTIARLVCMRRPTVSATLTRLVRQGELARNDDGTWTLTASPPDLDRVGPRRDDPRRAAA
jgi:CRP/FNR family cyclic AMP-dependent transcriptional regulator